uniref:Uncharacterized protein n=1 Tax=Anguilla anguilla TaxID=7936 RepID=A0A0E9VI46_ANGAN
MCMARLFNVKQQWPVFKQSLFKLTVFLQINVASK